jgi:hypothetical protein
MWVMDPMGANYDGNFSNFPLMPLINKKKKKLAAVGSEQQQPGRPPPYCYQDLIKRRHPLQLIARTAPSKNINTGHH